MFTRGGVGKQAILYDPVYIYLYGKSFRGLYLDGVLKNGADLLKEKDILLRMMTNK